MNFAPMLCVLFVAARMRGTQLAQGQTEKYQLPQPWVQQCMQVGSCSFTFLHPRVWCFGVRVVGTGGGGASGQADEFRFATPEPRYACTCLDLLEWASERVARATQRVEFSPRLRRSEVQAWRSEPLLSNLVPLWRYGGLTGVYGNAA